MLGACGGSHRGAATRAGGASPATEAPAMMMEDEAGERRLAPAIRQVIDPTRAEPQALVPIALTPRPSEPARVRLARLDLPPNGRWRPPASVCHDVLMLVREGELRAVGHGIAPPEAPSTVYRGDAMRFGPEGDGLLQNLTDRHARTIVAFVRAPADAPCEELGEGDPLMMWARMASVRTSPPLSLLGGALTVRILLDLDGSGARHGGLSVLEGDAGLVVPLHRHSGSAELLYVEQGQGILRLGERLIRARAGVAFYVPPGAPHSFFAEGEVPLRIIQVFTPAGPEQRYREPAP